MGNEAISSTAEAATSGVRHCCAHSTSAIGPGSLLCGYLVLLKFNWAPRHHEAPETEEGRESSSSMRNLLKPSHLRRYACAPGRFPFQLAGPSAIMGSL